MPILTEDDIARGANQLEAEVASLREKLEASMREAARLREENTELNQLFDLQQTRMVEATKAWRAATGREHVSPDLGALLTWLLEENRALREALENYGEHERECILYYWEAGEPTKDGGYRLKYKGKWYDTEPDCTCGLRAALAQAEPTQEGWVDQQLKDPEFRREFDQELARQRSGDAEPDDEPTDTGQWEDSGTLVPPEAEELAEEPSAEEMVEVDIVFDGPPGPTSGHFIEVESEGRSINFGEWVHRDAYWVLRFKMPRAAMAEEKS